MKFEELVIVITGGTGSFGHALIRKLLNTNIKEVRVFSRDEKKQDDMRKLYIDSRLKYYLGDVRDISSVDNVMTDVDIVFHAAAIKQVPSAEFFPIEAVKTNILGSQNVLISAIHHNVKKVICLSTDKAAYPINAMGISKAMMERVATSMARGSNNKTDIIISRYGNVIGSRASVVPLFFEQISNNFLTITDPNMTRFLMSLDDAIELVLHAIEFGVNGDLFVKKSPSARVIDIANAVVEITGKKVDFKFIGPRHSEKYHETLLTKEELDRAIDLGFFYRVPIDHRDLNYEIFSQPINSHLVSDYSSDNTTQLNVREIVDLFRENHELSNIIKGYLDE